MCETFEIHQRALDGGRPAGQLTLGGDLDREGDDE